MKITRHRACAGYAGPLGSTRIEEDEVLPVSGPDGYDVRNDGGQHSRDRLLSLPSELVTHQTCNILRLEAVGALCDRSARFYSSDLI